MTIDPRSIATARGAAESFDTCHQPICQFVVETTDDTSTSIHGFTLEHVLQLERTRHS
jgi:hypothetical protein